MPEYNVHAARLALVLALLGGLLAACSSTDIGNPEGDPDMDMVEPETTTGIIEFTAWEPDANPAGLTLSSGLVVDELWLSIGSMHVIHGEACDERTEIALEQPLVVELISGLEHPIVPGFTADPGSYCGLDIELTTAAATDLPAGSPDDLIGGTLVLLGATTDGVAFLLRDVRDGLLGLEAPTPDTFTLAAGREHLFVAFELSDNSLDLGLLDDLLGNLLGETLIIIDETTGLALLDGLRTNLFGSAALWRDANDDGVLAPTERDQPLATASP